METILRPHQQRIVTQNPNRALLVHEMRTGKSLIAKLWSEHESRNKNAYVICLKSNKDTWKNLCPHATVYTKEEFKKCAHTIINPTSIVVDEATFFASPLFIAKIRSQIATCLYTLIKNNPEVHVLLLTATPLTNNPASIHTLLVYIGKYIPWGEFQDQFYELVYRPFRPRPFYQPRKGWREKANMLIEKYADVVSLKDCVDSLPPVIEEVITVKHTKRAYAEDESYHWTLDHRHQQLEKISKIKKIGLGYRKLIVVCHYTEQIDTLAKELEKEKPVFILDGRTKNQEKTIREAQQATDCFFIVQAKCSMGWDGFYFGAMIFASVGHAVIDLQQMKGRLTSVDNPKPCVYYWLLAEGDSWDKRIYDCVVIEGVNFDIHRYEKA